ncbi:hypothetical protein HN51_018473 [Arachis hypogaea]|uniref:Uncharacterized protein LOC107460806 n=2 Tax=Arachis TaxID=3817 RepID=A0A6P4BAH7_ARADU|nr:uncharacterized protein LOC107460806 [Arachis duranensis]XP_015934696.1 uncharacterized protein LOC107460806 [Arachis duranensis]XP_025613090.1 phosphatidylinositol transfer protein 3 [Arachis hypogaea]XP_025613091.1 phosphatidylinositol transfer protein 3 [Arachis hypogaea]QHO30058.1 Random slug protein [Arachis hypogaea]QHO30059.1 Random slug protein [Arachis hypogaea]RYR41945.1 hypothetical protein Ahy_A08g038385 [Arachis hypogaea]
MMSSVDHRNSSTVYKGHEKISISQEEQEKINEVRRLIGPLSAKASVYCSDLSISRYLRSKNWNVKKATQMLQRSLKWREEYKPEEIRWEDVANDAETGKIYMPGYYDRHGRTVLVMRPSRQRSTHDIKEQIMYFVYCIENAIFNLPPNQEEIVWLVDFQGYTLANLSFKITRETAFILQEYYPERLGLGFMYNAPRIFRPFYAMVKPLLESKTYNRIKFGYSNDHNTKKMIEDLFDMDQLDSAFGGNNDTGFDIVKYAERMKEQDKKVASFWALVKTPSSSVSHSASSSDSTSLDPDSDGSNTEN